MNDHFNPEPEDFAEFQRQIIEHAEAAEYRAEFEEDERLLAGK